MNLLSLAESRASAIVSSVSALLLRFFFWIGFLGWIVTGVCAAETDERTPLTTVAQIRALRPDEAQQGRPVQLRAVVTHYDSSRSFLFLQDATGGIHVRISPSELPLARGQLVSMEGVTDAGAFAPVVVKPVMTAIEMSTLPEARIASIPQLVAGTFDCRLIEVTGVVTSVEITGGRSHLHLHNGSEHIDIALRDFRKEDPRLLGFVDAAVRVRGVVAILSRSGGGARNAQVFAVNLEDIAVVRAASTTPYDAPAIPIAHISPSNGTHRVKVMGSVISKLTNDLIELRDDSGQIRIRMGQAPQPRQKDVIEVLGFPSRARNGLFLDHAVYRVVAPRLKPVSATNDATSASTPDNLPLLQTIAEVSHLRPEDAARGYPVRLRGVVTFFDASWAMLFIRDATNGIFVWPDRNSPHLQPGQIVEVTGFTSPGKYVPTVVAGSAVVQAQGELPVVREVSYETLRSGQDDSQWVGLEGIVRGARADGTHLFLDIAADGGRFEAMVAGFTNALAIQEWVDAEVRVQGVCSVIPNLRRQAIGFRLFTPRQTDVVVKTAPPADPFALPERTAASLFRFGPPGKPGHRVKVAGVVTRQHGSGKFFLRDSTGGLEVELIEPHVVKPGDRLEIVGFPVVAEQVPHVENAVVRAVGSGAPPAPRPITVQQAIGFEYNADLVTVSARLVEVSAGTEQTTLVLQAGDAIFEAELASTNSVAGLKDLPRGSLVRLSGIVSTQFDERGHPRAFRVLLQSAQDCVVLRRPPWWTLQHALTLVAGLGVVILTSTLWVVSLRRRVDRQTALIRQSLEQESRLELRYRELFDNATDMVFTTDLRGRISSFNKAAETLTGCPCQEAIGQSFPRMFGLDKAGFVGLASCEDGNCEGSTQMELALKHRDGREVFVEASITTLCENGRAVGLQGIARDITERKRAEEAIQQLNATLEQRVADRTAELKASNQELEAFSYSVSHDLRAPLRAINGFAEILLKDFANKIDSRGQHYLNTVADSGRKMGRLVDDLLAFSRLGRQALAKAPLDLNDLTRQVLDDLRRHEPDRVVTVRIQSLPPARGDRTLVNQALQNLLSNAWKFTQKTTEAVIEIGSLAQDSETVYYVKDNGAGFDMKYAEKLFGVFQRLHRDDEFPGTGVGLAIVQRVIHRHGGRIWVEAAVGVGATFYFTLPATNGAVRTSGVATENHQF